MENRDKNRTVTFLMDMSDTELLKYGTSLEKVTPLENELLHRFEDRLYRTPLDEQPYQSFFENDARRQS